LGISVEEFFRELGLEFDDDGDDLHDSPTNEFMDKCTAA
jgi:hypothetical protein